MIILKDNMPRIEEILPLTPPVATLPVKPVVSAAPSLVAMPPAPPGAGSSTAHPVPTPGPAPAAETPSAQGELAFRGEEILERPDVVDARVYRLRSGFVRHNVYITLGWIDLAGSRRPIEIFFNSKDLTRSPEYAILTRLISALFRKSADPAFILEELRGIHDPAGGHFKNGRYMHSFYAEVADVIERFFYDVGILRPTVADYANRDAGGSDSPTSLLDSDLVFPDSPAIHSPGIGAAGSTGRTSGQPASFNAQFKICPECNQKSLKLENGCDICVACGYSKCDK